ncbi:TMAO/DMSO reductase [Thalassoglobus neptunius]|uniref:TMAO/DMSO reductase n=1 Tax=Thalassoglobus neptunius TaxID=1938619 RepID=A0A5C5X423_9PLAN|nr:sulfite oxidase-like oxidoreductase [Thalassoglobus neptunius]TWT57329.1 TMAO/DMSO reductase [Thalassoglobus neptunius]
MSNSVDPKYQSTAPDEPNIHEASDVIISSDTRRENRIPPGQTQTRKWPVLHYGHVPKIDLKSWRLQIDGLVDNPLTFTLEEFQSLPRVKVFSDFHCVTRWSRLGNLWEGVSVRHLMELVGVQDTARFVIATGYDSGWTTNLPLTDFDVEDALLVDRHDGVELDADHGGPVRLVVPRLYAWKSAKWLRRLTFLDDDQPGYWEQVGYHLHGDPWIVNPQNPDGERFRDDPGWQGERRE